MVSTGIRGAFRVDGDPIKFIIDLAMLAPLLDSDEYRARCGALLQMTVTEGELACRLELLRKSAEV